ncbi:MAG: N-acetyltransferase, partial [Chloroflexota bacterium]
MIPPTFEYIDTPRLTIRRFEWEDWQAVYAYASNAAVMRFIPGGALSEVQAREFVKKQLGPECEDLAVVLKDEGRLIGHMNFHPWFAPNTYEIGWVSHLAYQGRGYATEAAQALLRYGFETLRSHRFIATCQPENPASFRVMEKL